MIRKFMIRNSAIQRNVPLAPYTTFGIGGPADFFVLVHSRSELIETITYSRKQNIPFFILGMGANILVGDKGFRGLVIKNEAKDYKIIPPVSYNQNYRFLLADSGITVEELIAIALEEGLSGVEHFAGIPSTLGGAIWQNLHFLSQDRTETIFIGDILLNAKIVKTEELKESDSALEIEVDKTYFRFGYDYSILHDTKDVVLSATLQLKKEDRNSMKETISANLAWRKEKHPENSTKTSAGSVFKKIPARPASGSVAGREGGAGRFIEKVGLKGYQIGGAMISPKHANFIVNKGNATAKDVRQLISLTQEKVKKELGLELQTEISFIGEF